MLKFIPIGGIGTVTKNMYVYEQDGQILVVDCGIGFPDSTMLGVDLLIPDASYLEKRKHQIAGILLTHGHDDHIAGLSYVLPKLGDIPLYASRLTGGFIQDRLKEFAISPNITEIGEAPFSIGPFNITPIKVTHSVPDARHFAIETKVGTIYHGSDYKLDPHPVDGVTSELDKVKAIGQKGVLCLISDCLRVEKTGHSLSESVLTKSFQREIKDAQGKFIVTLMSSNVHRIQQAVDVAASHNRRIAFVGRSVESNVRTASRLGFLKIPQKALINKRQIKNINPREVAVIIAGSQGQEGSSLTRAVAGEHKDVKINPEDKVVFASEPIPGNESFVYSLIDDLAHLGCDVAYSDVDDNLHVSGHAYAGEQQQLIELTRPKLLIPIGGTYRHMIRYRHLAQNLGYSRRQIMLLDQGQTVEFTKDSAQLGKSISLKEVLVDGLGVGDVGSIVLNDRQAMAQDGIVVVIVPIRGQTGQLTGRIEVISRGFVYMRQSQELVKQIQHQVKQSLGSQKQSRKDLSKIRQSIQKNLEKFLYKKTQRRPLILTVLLKV